MSWLSKWAQVPKVHYNIHSFKRRRNELWAFIHRNRNSATEWTFHRVWTVGTGTVTSNLNVNDYVVITVHQDAWLYSSGAKMWYGNCVPNSSWFTDIGFMELMVKGVMQSEMVKEILLQE